MKKKREEAMINATVTKVKEKVMEAPTPMAGLALGIFAAYLSLLSPAKVKSASGSH